MDNAIGCFVVLLLSILLATLVLMVATSTAVFYHQDEDVHEAGRYTCYYFTGIGDFTTSIKSSTGCKWLISTAEEWTEEPSTDM